MNNRAIQHEIIIEKDTVDKQYWKDLWNYRELFFFLAWRDIKVRYKQTVIGVAWALLRPILTMLVFSFVFGELAGLPSEEGVPYPIMVFTALLPWQFFAHSLSEGSNSLIGNVNLVSKVYMPRLIIPASTIVVNLIDFFISFGVLALLMIYFQYVPDIRILLMPFFLVMAFITAYGFTVWFCALNVRYRDFRYIIPFVVQFGLYISPVGFSSSIVPDEWRLIYSLNPMVGVIDGFRWSILGRDVAIYWPGFILSMILITTVAIFGLMYFRKTEKSFADVL